MMRTVEVLIVIIIIAGAFIAVSSFAVLPSPKDVSPINLNRLALTTLQALDYKYDLSTLAFETNNNTALGTLQTALSASLPSNIIYNLTVYNINNGAGSANNLYSSITSLSNAANLGADSDAASYLVASSNVTYNITPQKIGANGGGATLYILNCSDAPGWWITGYTTASLSQDLYTMLSPYFLQTVMIQNTVQLNQILNNQNISGETVQNAVVINTDGEAIPIPSQYNSSSPLGYDSGNNSYAKYCYTLGGIVQRYNWTWVSIVGYPFYYVSNTGFLSGSQNGWGIYGSVQIGPPGLMAFLQGLDNQPYSYYTGGGITGSPGVVYLSTQTLGLCNYYGIYPSPYQTSTRALPTSIINAYNLTVSTYVFSTTSDGNWNPGAVYRHHWTANGVTNYTGGFYALGATRIPDIRLTALGLLCEYNPQLYGSGYTVAGTSRLVVLQLGLVGGA